VGCSTSTASVCSNICGDGIVVSVEACDDGNSVTGDGCSACSVDAGWVCVTGSKPTLVPSWCYATTWPKIIDYWVEDNAVLYIKFNETVQIDSTWGSGDWSLTIEGPIPPYNFTWELFSASSLTSVPMNPIMLNLTILS
jgi:cysteine-rich repeat protein